GAGLGPEQPCQPRTTARQPHVLQMDHGEVTLPATEPIAPAPAAPAAGRLRRFFDGDVWHSFRHSPIAMTAAVVAFVCIFSALFANLVAPHDTQNLATLELSDARLPPAWTGEGKATYLLGTDDQGRDILSALMFGARISLFVGIASVIVSVLVGV